LSPPATRGRAGTSLVRLSGLSLSFQLARHGRRTARNEHC